MTVLKWLGAYLLGTLIVCIPIGILGSSNIVWGEPDQYGKVPIPGSKVVHLPAGTTDASVAVILPGRGNETPTLPLPDDLSLTVAGATVTRHLGDTSNAMADGADTQRKAFEVDVPRAGDYRVSVRGRIGFFAANPSLWLGHGPPIPGTDVPLIAAVVTLVAGAGYLIVRRRRA